MRASIIFLSGLAMGTVLGILIAPESGRATVRRIKSEADRLVDKLAQKDSNDEMREPERVVTVE